MSTEKLSELSKPVGYYRLSEDGVSYYLSSPTEKLDEEVVPLYSQEYVSALLAELEFEKQNNAGVAGMVEDYETKLEAKDKRIAELERTNQSQDDHINQQQDRIDSLEKKNGDLGRSLGAAEKRLATPVRLPSPTAWMRGDDKTTFGPIFTKNKDYAESQWGDSAIALYSVPVGIKEAAFSDERNLMHINERGRETSLIWSKNNSENGDIQLFRLVGFTVEGDE
ncbi:ead/Ea22-like family protein [Serratia marcescens]|uniref:ead/Ea22-like family protein n=1 Tax=Serratia marcescens TaxID=615 RepID=UPI003FA76135